MAFFYKHNPKKFNYIPRYYDPEQEAWEKKKAELGYDAKLSHEEKFRAEMRRRWSVKEAEESAEERRAKGIRENGRHVVKRRTVRLAGTRTRIGIAIAVEGPVEPFVPGRSVVAAQGDRAALVEGRVGIVEIRLVNPRSGGVVRILIKAIAVEGNLNRLV